MSGRAIIIVVIGIIVVSSIIFYNIEAASTRITANFQNYYLRQTAQNIAQSGVNLGLRQLANDNTWRTGFSSLSIFGGNVKVRAFDTTFTGKSVVAISATGTIEGGSASSIAYVQKGIPGSFKPKAALTTNGPTRTTGGIITDGRDHTTAGALISNQGILGVWSTSTYNQGGGSTVGGTSMIGVDHAPASPGDTSVIRTSQVYAGGYPTTPDSMLGGAANGFPPGTLKGYAQSGAQGSQYCTDPSLLKYPLHGVTYVELASGGTWSPVFSGDGLLVIHNSSLNAVLKNPSGSFTGLIITDDINKINGTTFTGAMIQLTSTPVSQVVGNGNGTIQYSSQAVQDAISIVTNNPVGNGSDANVIGWLE